MFGGMRVHGLIAAALVTVFATAGVAAAAPAATLKSEEEISAAYSQGIARVKGGWIVTARFLIARVDEKFKEVKVNRRPIPSELATQGYNHVGDIDVVGKFIYAPLEQGDYTRGEQVTARYNLKTLELVDYVTVAQNENSFVTVDPKTMIAYSFDNFGGQELLRYDVRKDWAPLEPIAMSLFVDKAQGCDVSGGYAWISTSNPTNELYRVDLETGQVDDLGSGGHVPGEGEGIDATKLKSGRFHSMVIDPNIAPVWLGHFAVSE
ncbi:MAG: hypothetical protein WEA75_02770 [Acidimicrobiia bacterium]